MISEPPSNNSTPTEQPSDNPVAVPAADPETPITAVQSREEIVELGEEEAELLERLESVPPEHRDAIISYFHSGPLPPPHQLQQYDQILENGAERIFQLGAAEQTHRMQLQRELQAHQIETNRQLVAHQITLEAARADHDCKSGSRGHTVGALLTTLALICATVVAMTGGHPAAVAALVGLPIATIITVLVTGRRAEKEAAKSTKQPELPDDD